jgi:hypothetical protein
VLLETHFVKILASLPFRSCIARLLRREEVYYSVKDVPGFSADFRAGCRSLCGAACRFVLILG